MFGSSSSSSLSTEQSTSPTLRIPRGTTCFGICSVWPVQVLPASRPMLLRHPGSARARRGPARPRKRARARAADRPFRRACPRPSRSRPRFTGKRIERAVGGGVTVAERTFSSSDCTCSCAWLTRRPAPSTIAADRCARVLLSWPQAPEDCARAFARLAWFCASSSCVAACLATKSSSALLGAFQIRHLHLRSLQIAIELRHLIRRTAGAGVAKVVLRGEQIGSRLSELRPDVRRIERQDHLSPAHGLALGGHYLVHESREFGVRDGRRDRLDFAIARDRRAQILARDVRNRHDAAPARARPARR